MNSASLVLENHETFVPRNCAQPNQINYLDSLSFSAIKDSQTLPYTSGLSHRSGLSRGFQVQTGKRLVKRHAPAILLSEIQN